MKIVTAEIYICQYCNKRFLSKSGCKKHESDYCRVKNDKLNKLLRNPHVKMAGFDEGEYYEQRKT